MKRVILLLLVVSSTELFAQTDMPAGPPEVLDFEKIEKEMAGRPFLLFETPDMDSNQVKELFHNKVVFLNFWFAACTPCLAEVKGLNVLYDSLEHEDSFVFLSFTYESPEVIAAFREKHHIRYPIRTLSKEKIKEIDYYERYPTSIIVGPDRIIKQFHLGAFAGDVDAEESNTLFIMDSYFPLIKKELGRIRSN